VREIERDSKFRRENNSKVLNVRVREREREREREERDVQLIDRLCNPK